MSIKAIAGDKTPSPNDRILRIALSILTLPWVLVRFAYRGVMRLLQSGKSSGDLREDDQLRQSRARRTLRGLTPDHDAETKSPS